MSGRFAELTGTREVDLGPCQCGEGSDHDRDTARIRKRLDRNDVITVAEAGFAAGRERGGYTTGAAELKLVEVGLASWNLQEPAPEGGMRLAPIDRRHIGLLDTDALGALLNELYPLLAKAQDPLPNGQGARSVSTSLASASRSPEPSTVSSSTTPTSAPSDGLTPS